MKFRHAQSGFTLVEVIIYAVLFAALSIVLINSLIVMLRAFNETRVNNDLMESAQTSIERMTREIRTADSIDTGVSVFASNPGTLKLNTTDASGTAKTVQFDRTSNAVRFTDNGTVSGNLTGAQVSVTSLIFRNITTTEGSAVRIEMTLQSLRSSANRSVTIYDTVALRGSY